MFITCYSLVLVSSQTTSSVPSLQTPIPPENDVFRCEPITIDMCMDVGYDNASFPNFRLQNTQAEANTELRIFWPLIRAQCSNAIVHMLCAVYAPSCSLQFPNIRLRPCRNLCMHVRDGCEARLQSFGFAWPPHLDCNQYSNDPLCFGPPDPSEVEIPQSVLNLTDETPGTPVGAWYKLICGLCKLSSTCIANSTQWNRSIVATVKRAISSPCLTTTPCPNPVQRPVAIKQLPVYVAVKRAISSPCMTMTPGPVAIKQLPVYKGPKDCWCHGNHYRPVSLYFYHHYIF